MLPIIGILGPLFSFLRGPVFSIIDKLIVDASLKERLKAELEQHVLDNQSELAKVQRDIVLAEIGSDSWMTSHWRPCLMFIIMGFLALYGLFLPLADLMAGRPVAFTPRWADIPDGMWNLLSLGVGGYVGGRSLEKLVSTWVGRAADQAPPPAGKHGNWRGSR